MIQASNTIHTIITGGTLDGFYDAVEQTARPNAQSIIPKYLEQTIKSYARMSFETLCMKDSKDLDQNDRNALITAIHNAPAHHVLITHGTDTMAETARFIDDHYGAPRDKTILLTGSMIPLKGFSMSDAGFNLGFAMARIETLNAGVYICMNARIFNAQTATKNINAARFEDQ